MDMENCYNFFSPEEHELFNQYKLPKNKKNRELQSKIDFKRYKLWLKCEYFHNVSIREIENYFKREVFDIIKDKGALNDDVEKYYEYIITPLDNDELNEMRKKIYMDLYNYVIADERSKPVIDYDNIIDFIHRVENSELAPKRQKAYEREVKNEEYRTINRAEEAFQNERQQEYAAAFDAEAQTRAKALTDKYNTDLRNQQIFEKAAVDPNSFSSLGQTFQKRKNYKREFGGRKSKRRR